ncbi:MAG: Apolipoprotein N-acyltransferase [Phycisphaerae bacterium]|nr:Apolipoprotein N-acyltransferase [Phycisphaerae bacterium]
MGRSWVGWWVVPLATPLLLSVVFLGMNQGVLGVVDLWPLLLGALVPWGVVILQEPRGGRCCWSSYAVGISFFLINTTYLRHITWLGYIALAIYFGLFFMLFAAAVRLLVQRWKVRIAWAVAIAWVGCEYLRGVGTLAFPFLFLAHGVYRQTTLIQIADLVGAYGVSLVVALVNGFGVELADNWLRGERGRGLLVAVWRSMWAMVVVLLFTVGYGLIQIDAVRPEAGPVVAVLQADYSLSVDAGARRFSKEEKRNRYLQLMEQATLERPDLVLFPEAPWDMFLNAEFLDEPDIDPRYLYMQQWSQECHQLLYWAANRLGLYLVIGAGSMELYPHQVYPKSLKYNSAFVYPPGRSERGRYDKIVLVMFGEYTPLRFSRFHFIYRWLDSFNPFSSTDEEFSLTPGREVVVFEMRDRRQRSYRFAVPICFEDLIPGLIRRMVHNPGCGKRVDFLLSISNDGWFNHGAMVPQHLAVGVFRAVENRVTIARSVNTACSGFIDSSGRIVQLVNQQGRVLGPGLFGWSTLALPIDPRLTLYSQYGDWFGFFCAVVAVGVVVLHLLRMIFLRKSSVTQHEDTNA